MKQISLKQILFLFSITIAGVIWSVLFHYPLVIGFFPGFVILVILAVHQKIPWKQITRISLKGIYKTRIVILILFLVSFLLPSWYLSGTINQMVQLALSFINAEHYFVLSFLVAMVFSMLLGTTVGTLSSIGVPILGTAMVLQLPLEIVAGALISGAFVGDRTSPFSSAHQLLAQTVEIPVRRQWNAMLISTFSAVLLAILFYGTLDYLIEVPIKASDVNQLGNLSLVVFIPPALLVILVVLRVTIVYAFLASILSAAVIAAIKEAGILKVIKALWFGIDGMGGGLAHMYELLLFLALAGAYNGLIEEMNVIQPYLDNWLDASYSLASDTVKTILATFLISVIAANQTLPIILTGRSFLPNWEKKYGKEELARVMGDTTMLFPGMIPWSVLAIMCSTIVGIPIMDYFLYAVFLWILPLVTLLISLIKTIWNTKHNSMVKNRAI